MRLYYTYVWKDGDGKPFYVGKGQGRRAAEIYPYRRSREFLGIYAQGGCTVEVIDEFVLESQAHASEIELIERYGRRSFGGLLINKTDGGEGQSGRVASDETRAKLRAANLGRRRSAEHCAKIGDAHRGKSLSAEHRQAISESRKGIVFSDQHRANICKASKGRQSWLGKEHKPSTIAKLRVIHGSRSEETRAKISAAHAGRKLSHFHKVQIGQAARMAPPTSGFKGVCFDRLKSRWAAKIKLDGKTVNLGRFHRSDDAARAYDAAAVKAWGVGNCYLNFPLGDDLLARPN